MSHYTTFCVGRDVHKDGIAVVDVTATISPIAIRNKMTLAGGVQILSWANRLLAKMLSRIAP